MYKRQISVDALVVVLFLSFTSWEPTIDGRKVVADGIFSASLLRTDIYGIPPEHSIPGGGWARNE